MCSSACIEYTWSLLLQQSWLVAGNPPGKTIHPKQHGDLHFSRLFREQRFLFYSVKKKGPENIILRGGAQSCFHFFVSTGHGTLLGFPSKFSLNEIRENERTKFVNFCSKFSRISMHFLLNFPQIFYFRKIFVRLKWKSFHFSSRRISNEFRESFERISQIFLTNFAKVTNEFRETFDRISQNLFKEHFRKNFSFRSYFHWLNEIFAKEIQRKLGNPILCLYVDC